MKQGDEQRGPHRWDDLLDLSARGEINIDDMLLQEGATEWVPACTFPSLFEKPAAMPRAETPVRGFDSQAVLAKLKQLSDILQVEDCVEQSLPKWEYADHVLLEPVHVSLAEEPRVETLEPVRDPATDSKPGRSVARRLSVWLGMLLTLGMLVVGFVHFPDEYANPLRSHGDKNAEEQEGPPGNGSLALGGWSDEFVAQLNLHRNSAGLRAVAIDLGLNRGCDDHAKYLARNVPASAAMAALVYGEDPSKPGFSVNGQRTAGISLICYADPKQSLERWMGRLFSRVQLLHPDLERIAIGFERCPDATWVCVVDPVHGRGTNAAAKEPTLYPSANQREVPCVAFDRSDDAKDNTTGFPISVTFPKHAVLSNIHAALTDDTGRPIAFRVTSSDPLDAALPGATIGIHPLRRLEPNRTYGITVTATVDGEPWRHFWHFTTGR